MAGLPEEKLEIVRGLMEVSPDRVIDGLRAALSQSQDAALAEIRLLVDAEAEERRLRVAALQPISALFAGDGRTSDRLVFPAKALPLIWRGLKVQAAEEVAAARTHLDDLIGSSRGPGPLDALARVAAQNLKFPTTLDFDRAVTLCNGVRPGGADQLASCFELAPIARRAVARMSEWINRPSDANAAAARLAYKDAVDVIDDAGLGFFELLAAQLDQPWTILRVISAVMQRPGERVLADMELAPFALRTMDAVDSSIAAMGVLDLDGGAAAGIASAKFIEIATLQIIELEQAIELDREGPWGKRIARQKQILAAAVEARFKAAEKAVAVAVPTQAVRLANIVKLRPKLIAPPDPQAVKRAVTLLAFAAESRACAHNGGFASARVKLIEHLDESFEQYIDEVLDRMRHGEIEDLSLAQHYLSVVAEFIGMIHDRKAAELVRRRAAAAAGSEGARSGPSA